MNRIAAFITFYNCSVFLFTRCPPTASRLGRHDSLPLVPRLPSPAHFLLRPLTLVSTATSLRSVTGCFLAAAGCTLCPKGGISYSLPLPLGEEEPSLKGAERGGYSPIPRRDARAGKWG